MTIAVTVTGVDGFVGRHVVHALTHEGARILGVTVNDRVDPPLAAKLAETVRADLTRHIDPEALGDVVVHLAGLASVERSFARPQRYLETNSAMVSVLGDAILATGRPIRLVVVSSGAVYGHAGGDAPIAEDGLLDPRSPYAHSKVLVERLAAEYRDRGVDAVVVRPFNHVGPGQSAGFLVPDLFDALCALPRGAALETRSLATKRDYTDVRDVARAYAALALAPRLSHGVYNVSSGVAVEGTTILALLAEALGREEPATIVHSHRDRVDDLRTLVGDAARLRSELGWAPRIPLRESVHDFVAERLHTKGAA